MCPIQDCAQQYVLASDTNKHLLECRMVSVKVTRDTCNGMGQHVFLSDWKKMRLNTLWMRQHCWMWQRLHTQCATVLCKKYVGFMTFRTAKTIVSYSTRHSTKPSTTTRHGHVVNYAVSLCDHAHQNTQIPCTPLVSIEEEKANMSQTCSCHKCLTLYSSCT